MPKIRSLFRLVNIKQRSFLTSCVLWFVFLNASTSTVAVNSVFDFLCRLVCACAQQAPKCVRALKIPYPSVIKELASQPVGSWVAPYYGCSLSPRTAARYCCALHGTTKLSNLISNPTEQYYQHCYICKCCVGVACVVDSCKLCIIIIYIVYKCCIARLSLLLSLSFKIMWQTHFSCYRNKHCVTWLDLTWLHAQNPTDTEYNPTTATSWLID